MNWKSKVKRVKTPQEVEQEEQFKELKSKYANVIAFLLIKNIKQSDLRTYFTSSDENKRRYEGLKKIRQQIIDARPNAKQWVDKAFYISLQLGSPTTKDDGSIVTPVIHAGTIFAQTTQVVSDKTELDTYMRRIAEIIDNEKIWSDPIMGDFDIGERKDTSEKVKKGKKTALEPTDPLENDVQTEKEANKENELNLESASGDTEIIDTAAPKKSLYSDEGYQLRKRRRDEQQ